jgi:hypothetical protein
VEHSDTPSKLLGAHAHTLVDLAVLLYAVGMQVAYQRMSSAVCSFALLVASALIGS